MDNMQNGINSILENPEMMQKIMAMAQSLQSAQPTASTTEPPPAQTVPDVDITMLQKLSVMAGKANIDNHQRTLLSALQPYLTSDRISRLERAMRAAKLAGLASGLLGSGNLF